VSVEFKNFSFTHVGQEKPVLRDITFKIAEGSAVGIVGRAGSGKSTLLKALNGLVPKIDTGYQDGDVIVDGLNTKDHDVPELAKHVGLVLDNPVTQLFCLTVEDDIAFGPANLSLSDEEIMERKRFALESTRLVGFETRNPSDLSGGEQQSCAIAGILAMGPKIIAMDEPIAMLDPVGKRRVVSVLQEVAKRYKSTIIVSESGADIEVIAGYVDRMILLHDGEVILDAPTREALKSDLMEEVGRPQATELFLRLRKIKPGIPIPITLEEAVGYLRDELKAGKMEIPKGIPAESRAKKVERPKEPIIRVRNLHHVYEGGVRALRGVDLNIYEGEIVGLIGQNGSGKTTLSLHLVGILRPTNPDAEVIVEGLNVHDPKTPVSEIIKHINYMFQNPDDQLFSEKVGDEIAFGPKMIGLPEDEIKKRVAEALKVFDIEGHENDYIARLPRNLKTYVSMGSILSLKPKILIIDEPTTGLDRRGILAVMDVLTGLHREGRTILIITHSMETVARYCSRVVVMKEGKILIDGPTREAFSKPEALEEAFIRPPQITQLGQRLMDLGFPPDMLTVDEMYGVVGKNLA